MNLTYLLITSRLPNHAFNFLIKFFDSGNAGFRLIVTFFVWSFFAPDRIGFISFSSSLASESDATLRQGIW